MVSTTEWLITIVALLAILTFYLTWAIKNRNKDSVMGVVLMWTASYVSLPTGVGISLVVWLDSRAQQELFTGSLTQYSLHSNNLLRCVIILSNL